MLSDLRFRARAILRRRAVEADLDDELRAHVDALADKYVQAGLLPDDARRRARLAFGGLDQVKDACRDARGVGWLETIVGDLAYAGRGLRKNRSFAAVAVLTLALGLGTTATLLTVIETILLKPLPYPGAERIVFPWRIPPPAVQVGFDDLPWGRVDSLAFAAQTRTFESVGAFLGATFNLTGPGDPARLEGARVSAGFLPSLGVAPALGRAFSADEDRPGYEHRVILSDALWRERFDADRSILGRNIDLDGAPYTVVGVMPRGFAFPRAAELPGIFTFPRDTQLWVPLALPEGPPHRGEPSELAMVGRLHSGTTPDEAQAELDLFARRMDRQYPAGAGWFNARVTPMTRQIIGETRRPLLFLLGAVAAVLLIVCVNIANLLLTRSLGRGEEFALRAALGAARGRLVQQVVTEGVLLAAIGGSLAILVAAAGVSFVKAFGPPTIPRLAEVEMSARVVALTFGISLLAGIGFGLPAALASGGRAAGQLVRDTAARASASFRATRWRDLLLVVEVALALVLVLAAGLLVRTFVSLTRVDAGFDAARVLTFELTLPAASYPDVSRVVRLYSDVLDRLAALPGVKAAGLGETIPMGGSGESTALRIPDRTDHDRRPPFATYTIVSPEYFSAVGTRLLSGRTFSRTDAESGLPVAIVSDAMARKFWPGQDALGKQVGVPIMAFNMTIVGIVADVKHLSFREQPGPEIYVPFTQKVWPSMATMHLAVRSTGDPRSLATGVRDAIRAVDPSLPVARLSTLTTIADEAVAQPRFSMMLVTAFGFLAVALACVGLYGAASYSVTQRTQEIGVRVALGAPASSIIRLVLGRGLLLASAGTALGLVAATAVSRGMTAFLFGVTPTDPVTFSSLSGLLLAVAMAACYLPARRAARIDPQIAIRQVT